MGSSTKQDKIQIEKYFQRGFTNEQIHRQMPALSRRSISSVVTWLRKKRQGKPTTRRSSNRIFRQEIKDAFESYAEQGYTLDEIDRFLPAVPMETLQTWMNEYEREYPPAVLASNFYARRDSINAVTSTTSRQLEPPQRSTPNQVEQELSLRHEPELPLSDSDADDDLKVVTVRDLSTGLELEPLQDFNSQKRTRQETELMIWQEKGNCLKSLLEIVGTDASSRNANLTLINEILKRKL